MGAIIVLTQNCITYVDDEDADLLKYKWQAQLVRGSRPYATRTDTKGEKPKCIFLHRVILERVLGRELLKGEFVDHIDNDSLNNSRSNLRLASAAQNSQNRKTPSNSTTGIKGITWRKDIKKYRVRVGVRGQRVTVGHYTSLDEAKTERAKAIKELHGEFARME